MIKPESMIPPSKGSQPQRVHDPLEIAVHLSLPKFRALWCVLMLTRSMCILFLCATTRVYWFMTHPYMTYYADLLGSAVSIHFKLIGVAFSLIGVAHIFRLFQTIYYSVRLRRFVLDTDRARIHPADSSASVSIPPHDPRPEESKPRRQSGSVRRFSEMIVPPHVQETAKLGWIKLFARRGFFGVESDFFHARFLFREVIEYISQTVQVYKSSILIAKLWINNLYVGLMVANCWSTPILQRAFARTPAIERLLCLVSDLLLDMTASMVIPLIIFAPYARSFDFETFNFALENLYDDLWFANMVLENKQIFALSQLDFIFKIIPHLSIYSCLGSINVLVKPAPTRNISQSKIDCDTSTKSVGSTRDVFNQESNLPAMSEKRQHPPPLKPPGNKLGRWGMIVSHVGLFLWGLAILTLHLLATKSSQSLHVSACKQPIRPWFATKYSCAVLNFNCYRNGSTGVSEDALDFLQEESLVALVFSHCPALTIPKSIRKFRNLLGIDIFNSTIVEWNEDAAITSADHPELAYIIFVRVNMTQLPAGVLQPLPGTATDFEISISNLTFLPDDLHTKWHPMALFYVEHTLIDEFPSTLQYLSVDDLSLVGNRIQEISEFPSEDCPNFVALSLTNNPLTRLPDNLGDTSGLGFLSIDDTQIRTLPAWLDKVKKSATTIHASNTPFCLNLTEEQREADFGADAVLTCSDTNDRRGGKYPLAVMAPKRPL